VDRRLDEQLSRSGSYEEEKNLLPASRNRTAILSSSSSYLSRHKEVRYVSEPSCLAYRVLEVRRYRRYQKIWKSRSGENNFMLYRAIGLVLDFIHRLVCGRQKNPTTFRRLDLSPSTTYKTMDIVRILSSLSTNFMLDDCCFPVVYCCYNFRHFTSLLRHQLSWLKYFLFLLSISRKIPVDYFD
jgi:hypothetical protein